jgi:hypothetical protein
MELLLKKTEITPSSHHETIPFSPHHEHWRKMKLCMVRSFGDGMVEVKIL